MVIITIFFLFLETNKKTLIDNNNNNELTSPYTVFLDNLQGHLVSLLTACKLAGKKVQRNNTFILP